MAISHSYWHLVVKNGNFTFLLKSSGQEWQFDTATAILLSRMAISRSTFRSASGSICQMHHGIYIMGCIWQSFWILQEKVRISSDFWIIRVVNSQLELYSHVICNPPQHPLTHPKNPPKTITNFTFEGSYLPVVIYNIVVKAHLGRSAGRSTPQNASWDIYYGMYLVAILNC